jgi:hypothetical protein
MGAFARARAQRDYLWENTLPRLVRRYADLVHAKAHSRSAPECDEVAEAT